jgi:hypothetical protein
MPRRRKDHQACQVLIVDIIRRKRKVYWATDLKPAMERANLQPSTFAVWNLINAGIIKRVGRGLYRAV